jgi:hypothetical protein
MLTSFQSKVVVWLCVHFFIFVFLSGNVCVCGGGGGDVREYDCVFLHCMHELLSLQTHVIYVHNIRVIIWGWVNLVPWFFPPSSICVFDSRYGQQCSMRAPLWHDTLPPSLQDGGTALHHAASQGHGGVAEALLKAAMSILYACLQVYACSESGTVMQFGIVGRERA